VAVILSILIVGGAIVYKRRDQRAGKAFEEEEALKVPLPSTVMVHYSAPRDNNPEGLFREIEQKWQKPMSELPVHVDLPRLGKCFPNLAEISLVQGIQVTHNGNYVWPPEFIEPGMRREQLILSFLCTLAKLVEGIKF
jgi:hypothetical protein